MASFMNNVISIARDKGVLIVHAPSDCKEYYKNHTVRKPGENEIGKWKTKIVPLGEGMVDYSKFSKEINRLDIHADCSIHYEYDLGGAEYGNLHPKMEPNEIYKTIKKDLTFLKKEFHKG